MTPAKAAPSAMPRPMRIVSPRLQKLYALWLHAADGYRMPDPGRIGPVDLADELPNLLHVEVVWPENGAPSRFRYRTIGMALQRFYGSNPEGKYVDQMPNPLFRRIAGAAYREVVESRAPTCQTQRFYKDFWFAAYERLLLPLSADSDTVTSIIGCIVPKVGVVKDGKEAPLEQEMAAVLTASRKG
ncbi:PAS domain-containing protein [Oceanibaculum nanhaiense]|uniref:PAS domain-containing protein n=1 Tax=Oceanibaculum nanhaiense TaxID=1909734 RepID=UPI000A3BA98D|nr:PAS domain-containing protein [Oceanibaculum nanhaiense]